MTPFVLKDESIAPASYKCFKEMRELLSRLPDDVVGEELSCHLVCHALAKLYGVEAVDGRFGKVGKHSWLVLERKGPDPVSMRDCVIADMYPVAVAEPMLIFAYWMLDWRDLYTPDPAFVSEEIGHPDFPAKVETIRAELERLRG